MRLNNVLNGYKKSILEGTYAEESAAIYNLLQDLRGANAADVALLGLTGWVDAIDQAEQRFLSFYNERHEAIATRPKGKLTEVRVEVDTLYNAMMGILDGTLVGDGLGGDVVLDMNEPDSPEDEGSQGPVEEFAPAKRATSGNATYDFVVRWNEILVRYRNLLHQRAGRKAKAKEEEEEKEDPDFGPVED